LHASKAIVAVSRRAQHDHAWPQRELGVRDAAPIILVDRVALETKRIAKPSDHPSRVAVTETWNHPAAHLVLLALCHDEVDT
jgi:hypothetical protein